MNDQAFARAFAAAPATHERLARLCALVVENRRAYRLMGAREPARMWNRHVLDSTQLWALAPYARAWADLGAGGGFPGLALACVLAEQGAGWSMTLVERAPRKADFLDRARAALGLDGAVIVVRDDAARWLRANPDGLDAACARAFVPPERLLALTLPALARGARVFALAGRTAWRAPRQPLPLTARAGGATLRVVRRVHPSRASSASGIVEFRCVP